MASNGHGLNEYGRLTAIYGEPEGEPTYGNSDRQLVPQSLSALVRTLVRAIRSMTDVWLPIIRDILRAIDWNCRYHWQYIKTHLSDAKDIIMAFLHAIVAFIRSMQREGDSSTERLLTAIHGLESIMNFNIV